MNIFKQMYTVRRYKGTSWDSGTAETTYLPARQLGA